MAKVIYRNAIKTPDGTIIESRHRWDYVEHKDSNGEIYMVDGGHEYFRGSLNKEKPTLLHLTSDNSHSEIRQGFSWGTYGPNGDQPKSFVFLKDMSEDHIEAILKTQHHITNDVRNLFITELNYRRERTNDK